MKFHQLETKANKTGRRAGRGISAGRGKTAGRGTKGQNSRSGGKRRPGFEGGQNPLMQRIPKQRGGVAKRPNYQQIFTDQLGRLKSTEVNNASLHEAGLINNLNRPVKLVLKTELDKKYSIHLAAATAGALAAVEKAGGSFTKAKKTTEKSE